MKARFSNWTLGLGILASLATLFGIPSAFGAIPNASEQAALTIARQINGSKNPKDMAARFGLTVKDEKTLKGLTRLPTFTVTMPSSQTIKVTSGKVTAILDFANFKSGEVLLNQKSIKLEKAKSFADYTAEVDRILYPKKKGAALYSALVNEAHAWSWNPFSALFGGGYSSASHMYQLRLDKISDTSKVANAINETMQNEYENWKRHAQSHNSAMMFATMTFDCKNGHLDMMKNETLVFDGRPWNIGPKDTFVRKDDGTFLFKSERFTCVSDVSAEGKVSTSQRGCPAKGEDVYELAPFFSAPQVGELCCQTDGCEKSVKAKVSELTKSAIAEKTPPATNSPSENGGVE